MKTALVLAVFECLLLINWLQQFGLAAPATMPRNSVEDGSEVSFDVRRDANYRTTLFGEYICRVRKAIGIVRTEFQSMDAELCHVGLLPSLPLTLQQRYNSLTAPQCTKLTYIKTFIHKMLSIVPHDPDIQNIVCHLDYAASHLNLIHVDLTGPSCPMFKHSELLQIYDSMNVYHLPAPISKYCILKSLDRDIGMLLTEEGHGLSPDIILPPCNPEVTC